VSAKHPFNIFKQHRTIDGKLHRLHMTSIGRRDGTKMKILSLQIECMDCNAVLVSVDNPKYRRTNE
jgi:hypothetical protein